MENITINNNTLFYRDSSHTIISCKHDEIGVLLNTDGGIFRFLFNETIVNGNEAHAFSDFGIDGTFVTKLPNYYGLEQGLFKSSLFSKYIMDYNTKGLLFTATIQNGKRGEDVNELTLLAGLQVMGIDFTQEEKDFINNVFAQNNFSVRLS